MAKGRRGNNEGLIRKRPDGRWEARITLDNGKIKSIYAKTRQEVAQLLTTALRDKAQGTLVLDERQTLAQYFDTWLETVRYQIKPSSWRRYGNYVQHIVTVLGKVTLAKLSAQQVQIFYTRKLKDGLSTTTVHNIHGMFHRALDDALQLGVVNRNVTEMVKPPRKGHKEMATLSVEQVKAFLGAVAGDRFEALYLLALSTGMRQGELLGIRWQDLDLDNAILQVRLSVQEDGYQFILAEPKTSYSRRRIALTKVAIEALQRHKERQNEEREKLGGAWNTSIDLVFPNTIGGLMIPDNLAQRQFPRHLVKAGLPDIRFHDLRHTAATILLSRGVNIKVVSEMLGHSDISITLRIYAHVIPDMQQAAVAVMDTLLADVF